MKVLQFITSLGYGGAERLIVDIAPRLKLRGVDVSMVSLNEEMPLGKDLEKYEIPLYTLSHSGTIYSFQKLARSGLMLRKLVKELKPDIVHSHVYMSDILARLSVPVSCHLVSTLHGRDGWWYQPTRIRSLGKTYLDSVTGKVRNVRFISVSDDVRNAAETMLKISKNRSRVISNGIALDRIKPKSDDAPLGRRIIQVGRFYPEKNHLMALRAFRIVLSREPDSKLIFVGDGPLRHELEWEALQLGISHAVEFMGARNDVAEQLRNADLFWMTSLNEGFGIACVEAMACGLPSVVTSVGGLPELVIDGISGRLVASNDHEKLAAVTLELFANPEMASKIGKNSRQRVENCYSVELTADRYVQAYKDILQGAW